MTKLSEVFTALRTKNWKQYLLLMGCCFISTLLITAYICIMLSPTVMSVLPQSGDSRKQVMMIFTLAFLGCYVFVIYAFGLFFRHKSHEIGILLALGATRRQINNQFMKELLFLSIVPCIMGALLGTPFSWSIWQIFRLTLVDTQEMALVFDIQAYSFTIAFIIFVLGAAFIMLSLFMRRTNIIEVIYESRKSEPIRKVPRCYGFLGIFLTISGLLFGYFLPALCINILQWYPPDGLTAIGYFPAIFGVYMFLLHTIVNGWRKNKNRYKGIISSSIMKFQGRQTVRNMLVITVLIAGAYFAAFYVPNMAANASEDFSTRKVDYAFRYRADQNMLTESEIRQMAFDENVSITSYVVQPTTLLGVDGWEYVEKKNELGVTYDIEYIELSRSEIFLSESAYNALTGDDIDIEHGTIMSVYDDDGNNRSRTTKDVKIVTNPITNQVLHVTPSEEVLRNSMLFGSKVLDDVDYMQITNGLTDEWREFQVFFNVENDMETYNFAKRLFYAIVDRSLENVAIYDVYDPIVKKRIEKNGVPYFLDREYQEEYGYKLLDYEQCDSTMFRMYWNYMPDFRVLDKADFIKTYAVFLVLFFFIAIICFAAVAVIAYTRSTTIAITSAQVYDDLRHLGASNAFLSKIVKEQISKVFFMPILMGSIFIYIYYAIILFFNDGGFTKNELLGLEICLGIVVIMSIVLYGVYHFTLRKVCAMLRIKKA